MAISRDLTQNEVLMLRTVFGSGITYSSVKIHNEKWHFFQPDDTTMTPNGEEYWNPGDYLADFSPASVPLSTRAWFIHEGAHLYQYYGLKWSVIARGIVSRNYDYKLDPSKTKLSDYKLEEMGDIAADYYTLKNGGTIKASRAYSLKDYAALLPIP
jgi:hypothetical protein